jgi:hypothetical protein
MNANKRVWSVVVALGLFHVQVARAENCSGLIDLLTVANSDYPTLGEAVETSTAHSVKKIGEKIPSIDIKLDNDYALKSEKVSETEWALKEPHLAGPTLSYVFKAGPGACTLLRIEESDAASGKIISSFDKTACANYKTDDMEKLKKKIPEAAGESGNKVFLLMADLSRTSACLLTRRYFEKVATPTDVQSPLSTKKSKPAK